MSATSARKRNARDERHASIRKFRICPSAKRMLRLLSPADHYPVLSGTARRQEPIPVLSGTARWQEPIPVLSGTARRLRAHPRVVFQHGLDPRYSAVLLSLSTAYANITYTILACMNVITAALVFLSPEQAEEKELIVFALDSVSVRYPPGVAKVSGEFVNDYFLRRKSRQLGPDRRYRIRFPLALPLRISDRLAQPALRPLPTRPSILPVIAFWSRRTNRCP